MRLLKLELKRVLKTRLTAVLLLLAFALTFFLAWMPTTFPYASYLDENGEVVYLTGMDAFRYKQEVQSELNGTVTTEKVRQALETYQAVMKEYGVERQEDLPAGVYGSEILPYAPLLHGIIEASADPETGVGPSLMDIDPESLEDYYAALEQHIRDAMALEQERHPTAQKIAISLYDKVTKPYQFSAAEYPTDAMDYEVFLAFLIMCLCAVIAAPVFTSDYQTGADDILRCTKYGKVRFALTKITSALLICGITSALCGVFYIVVSNSLFGWETTKTSMQILYSIVTMLDMDVAGLQWYTAVTSLLSVLATVSFILFLSSKCKNMIIAMSAALVSCLMPFLVYMALPYGVREWAYCFLPSSGAGLQTSVLYSSLDFFFLNVGNLSVWLPHVMIAVCIIEIPLFIWLTVTSYVRHRV